jgi:hypothetical protein
MFVAHRTSGTKERSLQVDQRQAPQHRKPSTHALTVMLCAVQVCGSFTAAFVIDLFYRHIETTVFDVCNNRDGILLI